MLRSGLNLRGIPAGHTAASVATDDSARVSEQLLQPNYPPDQISSLPKDRTYDVETWRPSMEQLQQANYPSDQISSIPEDRTYIAETWRPSAGTIQQT